LNENSRLKKTSSNTPVAPNSPSRRRTFESPTVQFLYNRYVGDDPSRQEEYEEVALNAQIARSIYELRVKAGLSQRELARRVGTSASAICRIENADYDGHSLSLLKRIADALNRRVEIRFLPPKRLRSA
jgi:ribosome-binding protein aMBF1 (putative translation factor)